MTIHQTLPHSSLGSMHELGPQNYEANQTEQWLESSVASKSYSFSFLQCTICTYMTQKQRQRRELWDRFHWEIEAGCHY